VNRRVAISRAVVSDWDRQDTTALIRALAAALARESAGDRSVGGRALPAPLVASLVAAIAQAVLHAANGRDRGL
jgi:hypothetical protein